jgi:putative NADH-flavin reductase
MTRHALIAGVSGIIGRHLAEYLLENDWTVSGISRHAHDLPKGVKHIAVDLTDGEAVLSALKSVTPTDVFITTWMRQATEAENCRVNAGMVRNLLQAMEGKKIKHAALVTGTKHYMGPFEAYAKTKMVTPFREEMPRLPYQNFYYDQEDELFAAAEKQDFSWAVHRPHTLIGYAVGNQMNMAATLAAYAAICKKRDAPSCSRAPRSNMKPVSTSPMAALLQSNCCGQRPSLWRATMPLTSPTAKYSGGIGCGRKSPLISASRQLNTLGMLNRWKNRWKAWSQFGTRLSPGMVWRKTRSAQSPHGGTAMLTLAGSSKTSTT